MSDAPADYRISTDPADFDVTAIHAYLTRAYWSLGVPRETVVRAIGGSLCFGLFHRDQQVGFARVVTDRATFAYLCDVYLLDAHQGRGLGTWLMAQVFAHPELQGLRRFLLVTRDAHRLYERFGFTALRRPERHMEVHRPDVYALSCPAEDRST